jgi:non-ribosomal peptide synthase protein (TIGR01720 family)
MYPGQPQNYLVPIFLQCRKEISVVLLQTALDHMLAHHDALRVRFKRLDDGWGQENLDETCRVTLQCHDLSELSEPEQSKAIERLVRDTYGTIALTGPLLSASLMLLGNGHRPRLLIAIHHFVFDRVSQSIFMDDLNTLYEQLERGSPIQLPPKTISFRTWAARLLDFSRSAQLRQEQQYWEMMPWEFACLPKDEPGGRNTIISTARVSVSLDQTHTARLRARISRNEITSMRDALLAAVVFAVTRWSANRIAFVSVATHGRDPVFPDVDISRTIGWFARAILVSIQAPSTPDESQWLHAVTRAFNNVPNSGLGYAILNFLCRAPALTGRQEPELHFNDLGDIGDLQGGSLFEMASLPCHPPVPGELRGTVLSVETCVATGRVVMHWDYSAELHRVETIEALAGHALDWLRVLAEAHV